MPYADRYPRNQGIGAYLTENVMKLFDPGLSMAVKTLDDIESARIATENRVRQLTRNAEDKDGETDRGFALPLEHPSVARLVVILDGVKELEKDAIKAVQSAMKEHPLGEWVRAQRGVGLKQAARLLGAIGDPYWNDLHDRPRLVSELWAYCGYSVVDQAAQRRRKGVVNNWSDEARMRVRMVAESCLKQPDSEYERIYRKARLQYADSVHPATCVQCGPSGKPAQPDSPLSLGHQHARALRRVSKEILKDLWREAKRIHQGNDA